MESPDELKAHQRMEKVKEGKLGSWKVESPDEFQIELIKDGRKGMSLGWSHEDS